MQRYAMIVVRFMNTYKLWKTFAPVRYWPTAEVFSWIFTAAKQPLATVSCPNSKGEYRHCLSVQACTSTKSLLQIILDETQYRFKQYFARKGVVVA